jgi:hypothetical protein
MRSERLAVLAVCALAALGLAGAVEAGSAGVGSATGGSHLTVHDVFGLETLELQTFGFNAKTRADGSADGWYTYREVDDGVPFVARGPVTCLTVIGNDAWIGGTITSSNDPTVVGAGSWWHVTDDGEGAGDAADITTFLGIGTAADTQAFCDDHPAYRHPFPVDGGNIQVRDG